jgi:endo-1,4-beta-mannosidase
MWRFFDADLVRSELALLVRHGLNVTRSFFFWPDFMPAPYAIDEGCCERYEVFLDLSVETGIDTIPTFLVGHMSGANWDVAWREGRDLYSDGWMLAQQAWFIRTMAARFKDHPAVAGWLISNEMPLYGGTTDPDSGRAWGEIVVQAVRASGAAQPVSLGDGAWGVEVTGIDNGFRLRDAATSVDFIGPHVYPMSDAPLRQHLAAAFHCELSHVGRPVVLEEFGVSSDFASAENSATYYRQVLHSSLLAGATGWIAWNNTDFDLPEQDPYRHHPFEQHFGVSDSVGKPKPPLLELQAFRRLLDGIDFRRCNRTTTAVAILVSSYMDTVYPFTVAEERPVVRDILFHAYVAAREADVRPALCREVDGVPAAGLILIPGGKQLTAPTWAELERRAAAGATVYVSYWAGSTSAQRGPWHPFFNDFFGVEHGLRYGLIDSIDEDAVVWTLARDLGELPAGEELFWPVAGSRHARGFIPVTPAEAEVVATDAHGRPALTRRSVGEGEILLATCPLEYWASCRPNAHPGDTYKLYRALAQEANALPPVGVPDPRVLVDMLAREDGARFVWMISETDEQLTVSPQIEGDDRLIDVSSGDDATDGVELCGYGVRVFELTERS